ncbi:hypothetical protein [Glaciecola petra]|uniref:Uncharacterized protein n=1 Tax=Glaciecola petra TaxID=3075602 RepID=A0ABU2ZWS6_9ALTE|nr:hypothetical protein [Aestuariibacter sp. P117]MDT0596029.1 hypothetical protein [Aestuariibacter sp. P117]
MSNLNRTIMLLSSLLLTAQVFATNTSGVHGPVINPEDSSAMYRISVVPAENGEKNALAHRFHYQEAIDESFRWRVVGQIIERNGNTDWDNVRAELLWFFRPATENDNWNSGIRFDIRTRRGNRPEQFAINWTNEWKLSEKWRFRGLIIGAWQFGGTATTGTIAETRASLSYKLDSGSRVSVEMFNSWGKVTDIGSWNEQNHQLGSVMSGKLGKFTYQFGYLAGISNSADDHDFRFWVSKQF